MSLPKMSGAGSEINVDGKAYRVRPLNLSQMGELDLWAEEQARIKAWATARTKLDQLGEHVTEAMRERIFAEAEAAESRKDDILSSMRGVIKILRMSFHRDHPDLTDDELTDIIQNFGMEAMQAELDKVNRVGDSDSKK